MISRVIRLRAVALVDQSVDALTRRLTADASSAKHDDEIGAVDDAARSRRRAIDRRDFFAASASSVALAWLAACDSQGPRGAARALAYATRKNESLERWLLRHTSMDHGSPSARVAGNQFPSYFISKVVPEHDATVHGPWTLEVGGLVQRPLVLTLAQLMELPRTTQRVNHYCVEGWNAVAEFHGVSVRELATLAGVQPSAEVVDFQSFDDGYHESWDLESALHPQTLIVYGKDGAPLTPAYGAPARVHAPIKLGYKNTKYLTRLVFQAGRNGGYWSDKGYEWYGGT